MAIPTNILQTVQTYQRSGLAYLDNSFCFIHDANKKFKGFDKLQANLGATVGFDLPPRFVTNTTLVATFQPSQQRVHTLTVDKSANTSYEFSAEQFIFNVRDYMENFGKSAVKEIGTKVEADVAGLCETAPYRFYGDGVTAINSYSQLATALAYFRNYGAALNEVRGVLPDLIVPSIVASGLTQFVADRNEEIAMSWMVGTFSNCSWRQSNLLPIHTSGTIGNGVSAAVQTLTVVSVDDATGAAVTAITCTCDASLSGSATAILANDRGVFLDGVAGEDNIRYLTFNGHVVSSNPVQVRATTSAAASGTTVVLSVAPTLCWVSGNPNQNLSVPISAGMKIKIMPSHRLGLIYSGSSLYLAMPQLPEQVPFPTANKTDSESGVTMRMTYGSKFGLNEMGFVHDIIWGKTLVPEYCMAILFPVTV